MNIIEGGRRRGAKSRTLILALLGLTLALGAGLGAVGALRDDRLEVAGPSPSPTAGGSDASTASEAASDAPSMPLSLGADPTAELAPGIYRVDTPPMRFAIPAETDGSHWYGAGDASGWGIRKAADPCDGCEPGSVVVIVRSESVDVAVRAWTDLDGASISDIEPVELGGLSGVRFEGSVPSELNVAILYGGFNPHGLVKVHVLDRSGSAVVVVVNQYSESRPFFEDGDVILESFVFAP